MDKLTPRHDQLVDIDMLRLALSIVETPLRRVDGAHLIGANGHLARRLVDIGALTLAGKADTVSCQECDDDHLVSLTFDPAHRASTYFCLEVGRVAIDPQLLDAYELQLTWLLGWLSDALRIPGGQRPIVWIEDHLWELGEAGINGQRLRLFFACRISSIAMLERVGTKIDRLSANGKTGIVLTASSSFSAPYRLSSGFSIVKIDSVLSTSDTLTLAR